MPGLTVTEKSQETPMPGLTVTDLTAHLPLRFKEVEARKAAGKPDDSTHNFWTGQTTDQAIEKNARGGLNELAAKEEKRIADWVQEYRGKVATEAVTIISARNTTRPRCGIGGRAIAHAAKGTLIAKTTIITCL